MISESESCQRQLGSCTAVPNGDELRRIVRSVRTSASDDASPTEYVLAGWKAAMLAASTTHRQEAQEPVAAIHIGWDYLDSGKLVATYAVPVPRHIAPRLYTEPHPALVFTRSFEREAI